MLGLWTFGRGGPSHPQYQQLDQLRLVHGLQAVYAGLELVQGCLGICIDLILAQGPLVELFWGPHQQRL